MFFDMQKNILINCDKTNVKKTSFGQNKRYKKSTLFLASSNSEFYFYFAILIRAEAQGSSL